MRKANQIKVPFSTRIQYRHLIALKKRAKTQKRSIVKVLEEIITSHFKRAA